MEQQSLAIPQSVDGCEIFTSPYLLVIRRVGSSNPVIIYNWYFTSDLYKFIFIKFQSI